MHNLIDRVGEWNPQLFRELKGRLKKFPVIIALVTSLATQLILFIFHAIQVPNLDGKTVYINDKYCKVGYPNNSSYLTCPTNKIDMQLWWQDHFGYIFLTLSTIFIFTLLVAGTYLIINDLSLEERKGTLNFIRLSPQSETSIFTGKILGVPALVYLAVLTAIPFHIFTGIAGNISLVNILCFYLVLSVSCIFFYSIASLFGIFGGSAFSGFKPWLGSGLILLFLWIMMPITYADSYHSYIAFIRLFSPHDITNYLFSNLPDSNSALEDLEFFNLALGRSFVAVIAIHLANYALWTYWAWQGLKRCFRNPNATIVSKQQSYLIVASFEVMILGFYLSQYYTGSYDFYQGIGSLYVWNLFIIVPLFALILPHRQAIQDWARFRYQKDANSTDSSSKSLLSQLIVGEKSPATLAIAIDLLIAASAFVVLFFNAKGKNLYTSENILGFVSSFLLFISLITIYATIAQIMLMLKNSKRTLWAMGTVSAAIILPIVVLGILSVEPSNILWQFTIAFWFTAQESTGYIILSAFLCQVVILGLLNWYLIKQVRSAGESATKALFSQAKV
ncbi:MAG: hypothetical protein WBF90_02245 [Rivularia sp. (in: cyanobacteria)]|jgi:hypothetical protein